MADELVTIAEFPDAVEAHMARSLLESEGIACAMANEHTASILGFYNELTGGVKLMVIQADAERAVDILEHRAPSASDDDTDEIPSRREPDSVDDDADSGVAADIRCPRCHSSNVRQVVSLSWLMVVVLVAVRWWRPAARLKCRECGHRFAADTAK